MAQKNEEDLSAAERRSFADPCGTETSVIRRCELLAPSRSGHYRLRDIRIRFAVLRKAPHFLNLGLNSSLLRLEDCGRTVLEVVSVLEGEYWGEGENTAGTERTESPDGSTGRNMSNPDVCTALHRC